MLADSSHHTRSHSLSRSHSSAAVASAHSSDSDSDSDSSEVIGQVKAAGRFDEGAQLDSLAPQVEDEDSSVEVDLNDPAPSHLLPPPVRRIVQVSSALMFFGSLGMFIYGAMGLNPIAFSPDGNYTRLNDDPVRQGLAGGAVVVMCVSAAAWGLSRLKA